MKSIILLWLVSCVIYHVIAEDNKITNVENPYFNGGVLGYTFTNGEYDKIQINFVKNPDSTFGLDTLTPFFKGLGWPTTKKPKTEEAHNEKTSEDATKKVKKIVKRAAPDVMTPDLTAQALPLASPSEVSMAQIQDSNKPKYQATYHETHYSSSFSSSDSKPKVSVQSVNLHLDSDKNNGSWVSDEKKDKDGAKVILESRFGDGEDDFQPTYFRPFNPPPIMPPRFTPPSFTPPSYSTGPGIFPVSSAPNWGFGNLGFPNNPQYAGSFPFPVPFPNIFGPFNPVVAPQPPAPPGNSFGISSPAMYYSAQPAFNAFGNFPLFLFNNY